MKIFLSSLENASASKKEGNEPIAKWLVQKGIPLKWNLMSYYYIQKKPQLASYIKDKSELIMIDSGAHSFQKGITVDWDKYTEQYADFIRQFDSQKVVGYFEMDVDLRIGYNKVLQLRNRLQKVSDKIIPVWHKGRGIQNFKDMCKEYAGKVVAVSGFHNEDISDRDFGLFVKYAHNQGCRIHGLGITRKKILDQVPFDYTDSSSLSANSRYGRLDLAHKTGKVKRSTSQKQSLVFCENYRSAVRMQNYYYFKWKKVSKD